MRSIFLIFIALLIAANANATTLIKEQIPNAKLVASGRLTVFLFDVYDASFYTENGKPQATPPFALQLSYLRNIKGVKIADQSAEEMRNQERVDEVTLADWHSQMRQIFPDVKKGDSITGIYKETEDCVFYKNNTYIGQVNNTQFCDVFFDIWFGEKTSAPALRNKLIGKK
jgi:Chalcone isomerase-like